MKPWYEVITSRDGRRLDCVNHRGVVADGAKRGDDCEVTAFVGKEAHGLTPALSGP